MTSDDDHLRFMTVPGARLALDNGRATGGQAEILLLGNRAGLLSLANIVLWLRAMSWRREMLSLAELPFVETKGAMTLLIRVGPENATGSHGSIRTNEPGVEFEWLIPEDDLETVGLSIHRLVASPESEYQRLRVDAKSDVGIQIRLADAEAWL
jgi:hypothetical protein